MHEFRDEVSASVRYGAIGLLRTAEATMEDVLRWHMKVLEAFTWHRRWRQRDTDTDTATATATATGTDGTPFPHTNSY